MLLERGQDALDPVRGLEEVVLEADDGVLEVPDDAAFPLLRALPETEGVVENGIVPHRAGRGLDQGPKPILLVLEPAVQRPKLTAKRCDLRLEGGSRAGDTTPRTRHRAREREVPIRTFARRPYAVREKAATSPAAARAEVPPPASFGTGPTREPALTASPAAARLDGFEGSSQPV